MSQSNVVCFQTFQVMKKLNPSSTWNQLLAVPSSGLPPIVKPVFSISPSLPGTFAPQATSSHPTHGFFPKRTAHPATAIFELFPVFHRILSEGDWPQAAATTNRGAPRRHPPAAAGDTAGFTRCLPFIIWKRDATSAACLVEIRNVQPRALHRYRESAGVCEN